MNLGNWFKEIAGSATVGVLGTVAAKFIGTSPWGRLGLGLIGAAVGGVTAYMTNGGDIGNALTTALFDGGTAAAFGKLPTLRGIGKVGRVTGPLIKRGLPLGIAHALSTSAPSSGDSKAKSSGPAEIPVEPLPLPA